MLKRFWKNITHSARGELFNPLIYPFLLSTLAYGIGFAAFGWTQAVRLSPLYQALFRANHIFPVLWGALAIAVICVGVFVLLLNKPPLGKVTALLGAMLWMGAAVAYIQNGSYLTLTTVALSNVFFWIWQYLSLSTFRRQDIADNKTMNVYNTGGYDNVDPEIDSKKNRENNRGVQHSDQFKSKDN